MTALDIQISVEEEDWPPEEMLRSFCERVLEAAADFLAREEKQPLARTGGGTVAGLHRRSVDQAINAECEARDKATNVLSFPAFPVTPGRMPGPMLGDHRVAHETLRRGGGGARKALRRPFDASSRSWIPASFRGMYHIEDDEAERMEGVGDSHFGASWPNLIPTGTNPRD